MLIEEATEMKVWGREVDTVRGMQQHLPPIPLE
jgi:hypothetical protein